MSRTTATRISRSPTSAWVRELLDAQRLAIVQLRNQGAISVHVIHRIERDLDLEDSRLEI
jgi:monovalent cation/hydrogen antiporter